MARRRSLKCKERHPDIAFIDIQMLKMDGLEVLGQIRAMSRTTAVVMLTADGTLNRVVDAMKLGAVDFLEKPFDPKTIELVCEEILQRKQFGTSATVDQLLYLAELAQERKAMWRPAPISRARCYVTALGRSLTIG
jgi:DNA-binding NtrC family response regulator